MTNLLIAVIYLVFVSLGLPDSLLGSGWPRMQADFGVPSSYAGYLSMTICFMTIISALLSAWLMRYFHTKWIVTVSILATVVGLWGFSAATRFEILFLIAVPYGLGAGAIDAAVNHYVAEHYSGAVMNFLHCFYGVGAVISPNIMALALKYARWNEGYRWTAFIQTGILVICIISLPLWKKSEGETGEETTDRAGIGETLRVPGVILTLIGFYAYCAGEATCFLWVPSYFAGTKAGLSDELIASFGSLIFGGLMFGRILSGFASAALSPRGDRFSRHRDRHGTGLPGDPAYGARQFRQTLRRIGDRAADGIRLCGEHLYADGLRAAAGMVRDRDHAGVSPALCPDEHRFSGGGI